MEKYYVAVTVENKEALWNWRTVNAPALSTGFILSCYNNANGYYCYSKNHIPMDFKEVSFEKFQKEIMKIIIDYEIY